jgi:hypothetical protein
MKATDMSYQYHCHMMVLRKNRLYPSRIDVHVRIKQLKVRRPRRIGAYILKDSIEVYDH